MAGSSEDVREMTKIELKGINDLQQRILDTCYVKCMEKNHVASMGELHIGELACLDRCVPKYLEAHTLAQAEFQKLTGAPPEEKK